MKTEQTEIDTPAADTSSGLFEDAPLPRKAGRAKAAEVAEADEAGEADETGGVGEATTAEAPDATDGDATNVDDIDGDEHTDDDPGSLDSLSSLDAHDEVGGLESLERSDEADDVLGDFGGLSPKAKGALQAALLLAKKRDTDTGPGKALVYNALDTFSAFTSTVLGAGGRFFKSQEEAVTAQEYQKLCSALELLIEVQSGIEEREKIAEARRTETSAKSTLFEAARLWDNTPGDYKADTKS